MALEILFPNGQVLAAQIYIDAGAGPVKWDGAVTATISGGATAANQVLEITALNRGLLIPQHDYSSQAQAALTDTWTFKTGGSGGTTVATVTITYTDSTKLTISTVAKT